MLHLPAASLVREELKKVFTAAQHGLAVRGMHGEGTRPVGTFIRLPTRSPSVAAKRTWWPTGGPGAEQS
ncbi:MAG: hypothetical protein R3E96_15105 [Planctomycetota bacterium]